MTGSSSKQECTHAVYDPAGGGILCMQADTIAGCVACEIEWLRKALADIACRPRDAYEIAIKALQQSGMTADQVSSAAGFDLLAEGDDAQISSAPVPLPNPFVWEANPAMTAAAAAPVPTGTWGVWCGIHGGTLNTTVCPKCANRRSTDSIAGDQ
jgi:hypothetical protein